MATNISSLSNEEQLAAFGGKPARKYPTKQRHINKEKILSSINDLLETGEFSKWHGGFYTKRFEQEWAKICGVKYAAMVSSGTAALHCAYIAAGIKPEDHVLIPSAGYVSAASAAIQIGAIPVICDISNTTLSLDVKDAEKRLTNKTKAIVPIHMWGIPSRIHEVVAFAKKYNLCVIEDCAQSHVATYDGYCVGSFGSLSTFSFAPGKIVSTGQGGMVISNDKKMIDRVRSLTHKGKGAGWHEYRELGFSYATTEFQAILGLDGVENISKQIENRIMISDILGEAFKGTDLKIHLAPENVKPSFYKLPIILPHTTAIYVDDYIKFLAAENINIRQTHPPMHHIKWVNEIMANDGDAEIINKSRCIADDILPRLLEIETDFENYEDAKDAADGVVKVHTYISSLVRE